jgi:adenosylcobinamide-GDP ribazoletransferase
MRSLWAAIRFLTIFPAPNYEDSATADLRASVGWFPVIGLMLGIVAALAGWLMQRLGVPPLLMSVLLVTLMLSFSGGLHLDGLSDTADGFLSSRTRDRTLEIMRDSHVGAMGVLAIVVMILLKFAAIASVGYRGVVPAALLMPVAGRCALVFQMAVLPYARQSGLASVFYERRPRWSAAWAACVLAVAACGATGLIRGAVIWGVCVIGSLVFSSYVYRKIGGATGDTLGAACEWVEAVPVVLLALEPLQLAR